MGGKPSFLLVHGSWHGSWCWNLLRPALERRGYGSSVVDLPSCGEAGAQLGGLAEDAAAVGRAAGAAEGPVVVVGHSYGGAAITEARYGSNVRRLIYLCAFMPDKGAAYPSDLPPGPLPSYVGIREDGTFAVPPGEAINAFYADCAPDVARWAEGNLRVQSQAVLGHVITEAAWRHLPSSYVVALQDRALPLEMQRRLSMRASDRHEIDSSHSPFLSRPDELADLLVAIASQEAAGRAG